MKNWFEVKLKYLRLSENGSEKTVTDTFVFDAVSFSEAEARVTKEAKRFTKGGDFQVKNISPSNISDIYLFETGEWWFKFKIDLVSIDEEAGKEKKMSLHILLMADDAKEALERLEYSLGYMVIPYTVISLSRTNIADVFPYDEVSEIM